MNHKTTLLLVAVLSGCSTVQQAGVDRTSSGTFSIEKVQVAGLSQADMNSQNQKLLEDKLNEVLNFCLPRLSGYEKKAAEQAKKSYWLSMSGLIAGSVLAPALTAGGAASNAVAISALSGWSGATNFASQSLKTSGLSGSAIAQTRNDIIKNVKESIAVASDGGRSFEDRRAALMKARSECIVYEIAVPDLPNPE